MIWTDSALLFRKNYNNLNESINEIAETLKIHILPQNWSQMLNFLQDLNSPVSKQYLNSEQKEMQVHDCSVAEKIIKQPNKFKMLNCKKQSV
jgi:hypothetical protein